VTGHRELILTYRNGGDILFPTLLVASRSSPAIIQPEDIGWGRDRFSAAGVLKVSIPGDGGGKSAWILGQQQRAIALMESKRIDWPVPIDAFIADEPEIQPDQLFRVDDTKPLHKGLITELLPDVNTPLPRKLATNRFHSLLCDRPNRETASPFRGLIRRTSTPEG